MTARSRDGRDVKMDIPYEERYIFDNPNRTSMVGYHGTSGAAANLIETKGFNIPSISEDEWYGHGFYFWTEPEFAWEWAEQRYPKSPAVIEATIVLGYFLDIDNLAKYEPLLSAVLHRIDIQYSLAPSNDGDRRKLDCLVANCMCENTIPEVDTVKGSGKANQRTSRCSFSSDRKTQICVRNPQNIHHPKRIYKEPK